MIDPDIGGTEIERKGGDRASNAFGYESVHLIVRLPLDSLPSILPSTRRVCEIQLRTILQDAWAEVEHELVYGASLTLPHDSMKKKLASPSAMLGLSDLIFQETRDGQKRLREHVASRRRVLEDTIHSIHLDANSETSSTLFIGRATGKTDTPTGCHVDELIIEALSAHGNRAFDKAIGIYSRLPAKKLEPQVRSICGEKVAYRANTGLHPQPAKAPITASTIRRMAPPAAKTKHPCGACGECVPPILLR